ncbi:MAG: hypothetical protein K2Y18_02175 [Alphaproteobacteria bacterium]|jgi:hypothetical protein|nr:hypothetical protein [Alphaproteobacteria bacterium]
MIKIVSLDGTPAEYFESFDELLKDIQTIENLKLVDDQPNLSQLNWSFTIYSPRRVAALYTHTKDPCGAMQEAFEDNLPLIEICAGDYKMPLYIVLTANVDMDYLKRKWCIDWCTYHHLLVKEL